MGMETAANQILVELALEVVSPRSERRLGDECL